MPSRVGCSPGCASPWSWRRRAAPTTSRSGGRRPGLGPRVVTVFAAASLTEVFEDRQTALKDQRTGPVDQVQLRRLGGPRDPGPAGSAGRRGRHRRHRLHGDAGRRRAGRGTATSPGTGWRSWSRPGTRSGSRRWPTWRRRRASSWCSGTRRCRSAGTRPRRWPAAGVTVTPVCRRRRTSRRPWPRSPSGEADATIVYATDVAAAGARGQGVVIPDAAERVAEYPIAVVKGTGNRAAAVAFVDAVVDGTGPGDASRARFPARRRELRALRTRATGGS